MGTNDGGAPGNAGEQDGQRPQWMDSLPDAHKQNPSFMAFKEPAAAWDKFDALLKAEGKSVVIPDEKATDTDRAAFYTKLGRPETADKYSFTKPADLPESISYNPEAEKAEKAVFHKLGLSDAQAKELHNWFYGTVKAGATALATVEQQATEQAINTLKDEWKGDQFKQNSELAMRAFKAFAGEKPEILEFIEKTKVNGVALGDHPIFLRVFAEIGKKIGDDSLGTGGRSGGNGELSDEERAKKRFPATYK